jgi:protein disulfide-isomerase
MERVMKKYLIAAWILGILAWFCLECRAGGWETDFAKASNNAAQAGQYMLLDFCGSDWCGWCMKLDEEVFSKQEFKDYAGKNLVCVQVDFPRQTSQSAALKQQNEQLANKYNIEGYPTVVLLSPKGELAGTTGYQEGGAKSYVEHLKKIIADYEETHPKKGTGK